MSNITTRTTTFKNECRLRSIYLVNVDVKTDELDVKTGENGVMAAENGDMTVKNGVMTSEIESEVSDF